jgi:hypothetical protein
VTSVSHSLTAVLRVVAALQSQAAPKLIFTLNTDWSGPMSGTDLSSFVAAWRAGAISRDTLLDLLKRGEILPNGRTPAQERALIHGSTASVAP